MKAFFSTVAPNAGLLNALKEYESLEQGLPFVNAAVALSKKKIDETFITNEEKTAVEEGFTKL